MTKCSAGSPNRHARHPRESLGQKTSQGRAWADALCDRRIHEHLGRRSSGDLADQRIALATASGTRSKPIWRGSDDDDRVAINYYSLAPPSSSGRPARFSPQEAQNPERHGLTAGGRSLERTRLCSRIPCFSGKIQGISSTLAPVTRIFPRNGHSNQSLTGKFPTQRNWELNRPYQGIKSAYQGSFLPDQGTSVNVHFWRGLL